MPAPDFFIRSLIRVAQIQGREVLEAIVTSQFTVVANGGKQMVSGSVNGKAFSYNVPQALQLDGLMAKAEQALEYFDSHSDTEITRLLTHRARDRAVARFRDTRRPAFFN